MHATQPEPSVLVRLKGDKLYVVDNPNLSPLGRSRAPRGRIEAFTVESASRLRDYLLSCDAEYRVFGTLTYPIGIEAGTKPHLAKDNFRAFMERLRRTWNVSGVTGWSVCWWMELTKAGTIHFHFLSIDFIPKEWLARSWYEVVGTEDPRHLRAGTQVDALRSRDASIKYAAKYATKQVLGDLPQGMAHPGRWWGVYGKRTCVEADMLVLGRETVEKHPGFPSETLVSELVKVKVLAIMGELIMQGLASEVDLGDRYPGVSMVKIPSIHQRRRIRMVLMNMKFHASILFQDMRDDLEWLDRGCPTG